MVGESGHVDVLAGDEVRRRGCIVAVIREVTRPTPATPGKLRADLKVVLKSSASRFALVYGADGETSREVQLCTACAAAGMVACASCVDLVNGAAPEAR